MNTVVSVPSGPCAEASSGSGSPGAHCALLKRLFISNWAHGTERVQRVQLHRSHQRTAWDRRGLVQITGPDHWSRSGSTSDLRPESRPHCEVESQVTDFLTVVTVVLREADPESHVEEDPPAAASMQQAASRKLHPHCSESDQSQQPVGAGPRSSTQPLGQ